MPSACSISNIPGMRGAHQAYSTSLDQIGAGWLTFQRFSLVSTERWPSATPLALASFIAMIEAVVRKARRRNAASGFCEEAVTTEVEPATLAGAKRASGLVARGVKIDAASAAMRLWSGRVAWVPLSCQDRLVASLPAEPGGAVLAPAPAGHALGPVVAQRQHGPRLP